MQFHLFYEGPFLSSQGDPMARQRDRKALHKHHIRRAFHQQLQYLWKTHPLLSICRAHGETFGRPDVFIADLLELVRSKHHKCGFEFVPLVCEELNLLCSISVLVMRRDKPGGILKTRDLDNRLKTLVDSLRMPTRIEEIGNAVPGEGETPFFVLLQNDNLITHVSVETSELLKPLDLATEGDGFARVLLKVNITPVPVLGFETNRIFA